MKRSLCVVLHDVASATLPACIRTVEAIREVADVPITLLAVPRYHCEPSSPALGLWLRARSLNGDEVALHGYTHMDDGVPRNLVDRVRRRHYTRGEGEFCDLSLTEATQRITAGVRWFHKEGLTLHGFVAPAWLMSESTWVALRWVNLRYTCTLRRVVLLPEQRYITSQSIVYSTSSAWRRQASVGWNLAVAATLKSNPLVRLELHPHDAEHAAIRRSWQGLLEKHLADRMPSTLAAVAEQFRMATDWDSLGHGDDIDPDSKNHQEKRDRHDGDRRADGDVRRIMQAKHHT
jgi:hypothetical protein